MTIPTALTLLRVLLIPVVVLVFYFGGAWSAPLSAAIFAVAAVTDWLDGYLARRLGQMSAFGAFLDPVADKLMVSTVLVLLVERDPRAAVAVPAAVIIGREIAVSALREFMAEIGKRKHVAVATVGKVKTTAQMAAIIIMLYALPGTGSGLYMLGVALLYVAAVLTLWSMVVYLKAAWPEFDFAAVDASAPTPDETPELAEAARDAGHGKPGA